MSAENVYSLSPLKATRDATFSARLPGSKSFTNRALLLAAQRAGTTEVSNALHAEDTELLAKCLDGFKGLTAEKTADGFRLTRQAGRLGAPDGELFIGGAGTPARFLLSFAAESDGATVVTGIPRLCERPMGHILEALERVGIRAESLQTPGCVPARIHGGEPAGTEWEIDGSVSSQFVSSLMLLAGRRPAGGAPITVRVPGHLVSRPYVEMTVQIMNEVGIPVEEVGPAAWRITPAEPKPSRIEIEPDASAMSYVLGAAAITGSKVSVPGIGSGSKQGDVGFARIMEAMGCRLTMDAERTEIEGPKDGLHGVDVDMELMPDVVLTLAVVAAFAKGPTRITNIANLRVKECDRIDAAATELGRMGVKAIQHDDSLEIHPGDPIGPARIETYNDHRVAMSFALAGLLRPGIEIADPGCVAKSFPNFWEEYERFKAHHSAEAEHV